MIKIDQDYRVVRKTDETDEEKRSLTFRLYNGKKQKGEYISYDESVQLEVSSGVFNKFNTGDVVRIRLEKMSAGKES